MTLEGVAPASELRNAVVLSSTDRGQVSHWYPEMRHSLFTYFFLKGLRGDADENRDKVITVSEMRSCLSGTVPYRAQRLTGRDQTPVVFGEGASEMARIK